MRKFRPNIVVAPSADSEELEAFEEDFWGEMEVGGTKVVLTANCGRCRSVNVDFETGGHVENDRQPLKKMMKDRCVDTGLKFSPVFGRYGFAVGEGEMVLSVGDEVTITKRNEERTEFCRFPSWRMGKCG